jgi:AGCS family alanine or glycine:cation symporter
MGLSYVVVALIVILVNYQNIPSMFVLIFQDAFNFQAIFGGVAGSCLVYGIKRGLFSNEAGVGSAPNASASANVSHPAKQGLVQTLSVYIDTLLLCTATALMCLSTGVARDVTVSGAPYVQNAISTVFGTAGPIFITVAMVLFAFTTLLGNIYYVDIALAFLNKKRIPSKRFMQILCRVYGCERVYMCTMCDGPNNHYHVQLIPRYADERRGSSNFVKPRKAYVMNEEKLKKARNFIKFLTKGFVLYII